MSLNQAKGILIALWFLTGCGKTEVRTGSPKQPVPSDESGVGSADAQQGQPKDEVADGAKANQPGGDHSSSKADTVPGQTDSGAAAPEPDKNSGKPSDSGVPAQDGASPSPETPAPPGPSGSPPPPPEVPLLPSKLGWNGFQLIGTNQLYFLPLD